MPLDPARAWLAAGITGLARGREWDAVATVRAEGTPGDEVGFVALADGTFVVESGGPVDVSAFAGALAAGIDPPYRALAVRRPELWAVGAVAIEVQQLSPDPRGNALELTWNGSELLLTVDALPAEPSRASALERLATHRLRGPYAAYAGRLRDDLWEISVLAL